MPSRINRQHPPPHCTSLPGLDACLAAPQTRQGRHGRVGGGRVLPADDDRFVRAGIVAKNWSKGWRVPCQSSFMAGAENLEGSKSAAAGPAGQRALCGPVRHRSAGTALQGMGRAHRKDQGHRNPRADTLFLAATNGAAT